MEILTREIRLGFDCWIFLDDFVLCVDFALEVVFFRKLVLGLLFLFFEQFVLGEDEGHLHRISVRDVHGLFFLWTSVNAHSLHFLGFFSHFSLVVGHALLDVTPQLGGHSLGNTL